MSSLVINLWLAGGIAAACYLLSIVTREYSWTDRIWSVAPIAYAWVFAGLAQDPRSVLVACLVTAWGARLTFNFWRRGGYQPGGEDYRWAILRQRMPGWAYGLFNLAFIAVYQNALILGMTLPMWTLATNPGDIGVVEVALGALFIGLLVGETVSDQQRWNFHRAGAPGGVLTTGLHRFSRHPNYFFEIAQWWVVFAFGAVAAGTPWVWTGAGAVLLTALFFGSIAFTEHISAGRHAAYAPYRARTSMLVPWPPRSPRADS